MDNFYLGYEWNPETGRTGKPLRADLRGHTAIIAPTGGGKGVAFEIPNLLMGLRHCTVVSLDPSGQNAAVCARARRRFGSKVLTLNPGGLHVDQYPDLASAGCNPLMLLDPKNPERFFKDAALLADATIPKGANEAQPHFPLSGRGLWTWLQMHCRNRDGNKANLGTCRDMLMEAETLDAEGKPCTGLRFYAAQAIASGNPRIANMAGYYIERSREIDSIKSTCATATRFLEGESIRADLSKNGVDLTTLADTRTTLFVILSAEDLEFDGIWLRIIITCILNSVYRRGGRGRVPVLMMLSEFAQLGELKPIAAALGQARKYGVRLCPIVLQDVNQLREIYGTHGAGTFIANSRYLAALRPDDDETAEFLSRHAGEHPVPQIHLSDDPQGGAPRPGVGIGMERRWPPHKIRDLPDLHGLVWKSGASAPQPVYCPPYWEIPACRHARADPYHTGTAKAPRWMWKLLRLTARVIGFGLVTAATVAGFVLLRSAGPDMQARLPPALRGFLAAPSPASAGAYQRTTTPALPARHSVMR